MTRTVLVVDDSEIVLTATRAMLEEGGYRVSTHRRATGSVALILQTKPDLVLLDVNMPSLRGDMVARMSTATNQSTKTVVLLHSTLSERELQRLTEESGAHGYIRKTDDTQAFLRRVRLYLGDNRSGAFRTRTSHYATESDPASRKTEKSEGVLLIDQDMMALSGLRTQLQDLGYTPSYALSFNQANSKIVSGNPDVILISSHMKELESFLQSLPNAVRGRCVLLRDEGTLSLKSFSGHQLTRPISNQSLREAIAQVLDRRASTGS